MMEITARGKSRHGIRPSLHPGGLRCDSFTYSRYAPSSRLVRRAQDRSRCSRDFHHGLSRSIFRGFLIVSLVAPLLGQHPPPTLNSVVPLGGQRGTSVTLLLDGTNLGEVRRILFDHEGLDAVIERQQELPNPRKMVEGQTRALILDGASRNRLWVRVDVDGSVPADLYHFRVWTPLGVSNPLPFAVGEFPEVEETQFNDTPRQAQPVSLPVTVRGDISSTGDADHFRFRAREGQHLAFRVISSPLGSILNAQLQLLEESGKPVEGCVSRSGKQAFLSCKIQDSGAFIIRIADKNRVGAMSGYDYRLEAGEFPLLEGVFPLGVQAGKETRLEVWGSNLGDADSVPFTAPAEQAGQIVPLAVPPAANRLNLAVGADPETLETEPNNTRETAQQVSLPVTLNGHVHSLAGSSAPSGPDQDLFRFEARKEQVLVLEVEASRLGSSLDSLVEIWDAQGRPVRRAEVRCLAQTEVVLSNRDSIQGSMRLGSTEDLALDDYLMVGSEIVQIKAMPRGPDDDARFKSFRSVRQALFGTTAEGHAVGDPVYKVRLFPPGTRFSANGMPVFQLNYRNDDGGPGYGRDSNLEFTAPADGTYLVALRDARGQEGADHPYRLTIREPSPDFRMELPSRRSGRILSGTGDSTHFNLPAGGRLTVDVAVRRLDGFDGQVLVQLEDLPAGVSAGTAVVPAGADSTVILLEASSGASFAPTRVRIVGRAEVNGRELVRTLENDAGILLAVNTVSDLTVAVDRRELRLEPGKEARIRVDIDRLGEFGGRVPVDVRNLPYGVRVLHVGLNGILVTEEESSRVFTLYAEPWVKPLVQPIYVVARVETNSPIPLEHAAAAVQLQVGGAPVAERSTASGGKR